MNEEMLHPENVVKAAMMVSKKKLSFKSEDGNTYNSNDLWHVNMDVLDRIVVMHSTHPESRKVSFLSSANRSKVKGDDLWVATFALSVLRTREQDRENAEKLIALKTRKKKLLEARNTKEIAALGRTSLDKLRKEYDDVEGKIKELTSNV